MSRTRLSRVVTIAATVLAVAAGAAFAHETNETNGHWFEHQVALTDGGSSIIDLQSPPAASPGNGDRGPARTRGTQAVGAAAPVDCFTEEVKRSEGYIPPASCADQRRTGLAGERWVQDEDK